MRRRDLPGLRRRHLGLTIDDVELNVYFPINYVCMCFIAYATGSELIVRRYRKLYKKILKVTLMVILSVFLCVSFPLFLLLDAPTSRDGNVQSHARRLRH